jgi:NAD-dependent SIR2 family protein deacetylase
MRTQRIAGIPPEVIVAAHGNFESCYSTLHTCIKNLCMHTHKHIHTHTHTQRIAGIPPEAIVAAYGNFDSAYVCMYAYIHTHTHTHTQRIAGIPPEAIVAAHGNFDSAHCISTGQEVPIEEVRSAIFDSDNGWMELRDKYVSLCVCILCMYVCM